MRFLASLAFVVLLLGVTPLGAADPVRASADMVVVPGSQDQPLGESAGVPSPSPLHAGVRLAGALALTVALMLGLVGARRLTLRRRTPVAPSGPRRVCDRWLGRFMPEASADDRVAVLSRSYLGPRESVGVVGVGHERFLLGITSGTISLLARLPEPADVPAVAETDVPADDRPATLEPPAGAADTRAEELRATAVRLRERLAIAMGRRAATAASPSGQLVERV